MLCALFLAAAAFVAQAGELEVVVDTHLPASIPWPLDVRFEDMGSVLIGAGRDGIFRVAFDDSTSSPEIVVPGDEATFVSRLAVSEDWIVAGTTFGPLGWRSADGSSAYREDVPMSVILDLDVAGSRVWMLAARRDEGGEWAPEGAILWSLDLGVSGLTKPVPRMYAESGPGAVEMARCHILELGAVRSLGDGRWLVVPGVQPGVFVYEDGGKLVRAWQSEDLGFVDRCTLDEEQFLLLNGELAPRNQWFNQRRILDDAVNWGGKPGLLVRQPTPKGPRWELVILGDDGPVERITLPVGETGPNARLRADVLGDRLVVVVVEHELTPAERTESPRLIVFRRAAK